MPEPFAITPPDQMQSHSQTHAQTHTYTHTEWHTHLFIKDLFDLIDSFHSLVARPGTSTRGHTLSCTRETK